MATFETYYDMNPVGVIDQNKWTDKLAEVFLNFKRGPLYYTPLIDWTDRSAVTGAQLSEFTELLEGDPNVDPISMTAKYIEQPLGVDSRKRVLTVNRYGNKVQLSESSNIFQQWQMSGGRDWRPLLRGVLGNNVRQTIELLSRNSYLRGPKSYWTYAGSATDFSGIGSSTKFDLGIVNEWNLRLGNTGSPVIPGDVASAKVAIVPPGVVYDFLSTLAGASANEASMWRDAHTYGGAAIPGEIGSYKGVRFVEARNDTYGINPAVLYNAGAIDHQGTVTSVISAGDGAPDPETTKVDGTWYVGQKNVTHYVQLASGDAAHYSVNDFVSIHTKRTSDYGVSDGVDFLAGDTIVRRVVSVDTTNDRIAFDRPIMQDYKVDLGSGVYAYVTKAEHVGFVLVLGSRGGVMGNVNRPMKFYDPRPVDDFESVWRYVWDFVGGWNIWEPNVFECHFCAVSLPKPGGIITP